ncbi:MAG TPA: hypothetical protein VEK79_18450 [Thermoanaerobaculia bacterium]|nr:hypothetical protein [Thermoanaerobaculia bacterium]
MQGECVVIREWPVQFLPPTGPLVEEAMAEAVVADVERASTLSDFRTSCSGMAFLKRGRDSNDNF